MSCVAVSPTEPLVAAGDESGHIYLLRVESRCAPTPTPKKAKKSHQQEEGGAPPPGTPQAKPISRASDMHWHAQRVGALEFSHDGGYLYSVGKEGVLVAWQLNSGHQSFLPRLGAPLTQLACSPTGTSAAVLGLAEYGDAHPVGPKGPAQDVNVQFEALIGGFFRGMPIGQDRS